MVGNIKSDVNRGPQWQLFKKTPSMHYTCRELVDRITLHQHLSLCMLMTLDSEGDAEMTRYVHLSMLPVGRQTAQHSLKCSL